MKQAFCAQSCLAGGDPCFWLNFVKQGKLKEAWEEIMKVNPLPAVTGMVCPHPCESVCQRRMLDEAISIHWLEESLGNIALINGWSPPVLTRKPNSFKVAIVGSGPSGLSCVYQLARRNYQAVVFEELSLAGGMLRVAIPNFRLPKHILNQEISNNIFSLGVELKTNIKVDQELLDNLERDFDAVFLAAGLQKSRKLNIPGEDTPAVLYGLDFLKDINLGKRVQLGQKVVVIGGGNTAIDVARTAGQLGSEVRIFYRRTKAEMPAIGSEVKEAEKERVEIIEQVLPVKILNGFIEFQKARPDLIPIEGSNFQAEFDNLIIAAGEEKEELFELKDGGKIFVSQDAGTVAAAIRAGREAAYKIDQKLLGQNVLTHQDLGSFPFSLENLDLDFYLTPKARRFHIEEAQRCLGCGFQIEGRAKIIIDQERCKGCSLCIKVCPYQIIQLADFFNSQGYQPAQTENPENCQGCTWCVRVCPDAAIAIYRRKQDDE